MATAYKKSEQQLEALRDVLELQKSVRVGSDKTARQWGSDVAKLCSDLDELSVSVCS